MQKLHSSHLMICQFTVNTTIMQLHFWEYQKRIMLSVHPRISCSISKVMLQTSSEWSIRIMLTQRYTFSWMEIVTVKESSSKIFTTSFKGRKSSRASKRGSSVLKTTSTIRSFRQSQDSGQKAQNQVKRARIASKKQWGRKLSRRSRGHKKRSSIA